jgi:ABC-type multidrug transport system fused ATPase/permease subunit
MLVSGEANAGTVLTVLFAVIIGAFSLGSLGPRIESFAKASAAAQKIFQTLSRKPTIDSLDDNGKKPEGVKGNIELKNVSFIYPARPEGSPSLFLADESDGIEGCEYIYPRGEIYCRCWTIWIWKVYHLATTRTLL